MMKSRSRLDLPSSRKEGGGPTNLVGKTGVTSFLPAKPKGPTLQEIQEQKEDERKRKEERDAEALARREEQLKVNAEQKRDKREERIKRVQEARQKQEEMKEQKVRRNHEKEKEEKLALLKKREEMVKAEAARKKQETEHKLKEAEERRMRDEEERRERQNKVEKERKDDERKREAEKKRELEEYRKVLKTREEEDRKKKTEDEKRKKVDNQKREDEERQKAKEEQGRLEEEKRKATAHQERIIREREELRKIKEKEAARTQGQDMNSTYEKPVNKVLDKTVTLDQSTQGGQSYDMTPARHELPPEPLKDENNYGLEDLNSGGDTDDEDCPRKEVPKWAEGTNLRTALLKQCYMPPDLDHIFCTVEMPDLSAMFVEQRKRFFKRTSSACWEQPPESFKHSSRRF